MVRIWLELEFASRGGEIIRSHFPFSTCWASSSVSLTCVASTVYPSLRTILAVSSALLDVLSRISRRRGFFLLPMEKSFFLSSMLMYLNNRINSWKWDCPQTMFPNYQKGMGIDRLGSSSL